VTEINGGTFNIGGTNTYHGPVAGRDITIARTPRAETGARGSARADVGVLTVLDEEIVAVAGALRGLRDYRVRRLDHGPLAHEAWLPANEESDAGPRAVRIAAVQTLTRGTDSAALAHRALVEHYAPATVLLVGIAGGVDPAVAIGDVVLGDQVIAYDARRIGSDGTHRRGQAQAVAAPIGYRLNDFFAATPARQSTADGDRFRIHRGPIGSGNAVITDAGSEIRRWLGVFNEKVLAVETEAAGVAQSFHESVRRDAGARGWLTIRGISDTADATKNDDHHDLAARHAARVMVMLAPFLWFDEGGAGRPVTHP
jgi:adenosylhomocysteine nucleosidase